MPANKLLIYPHDVFLMVRLEFVQICNDELEAKILRIIERYIEEERTRLFQVAVNKAESTPEQVMPITKDVWVSISYRLFMSDLFGTIASENTIKKAINSLIDKKIIFRRFDKKNRYDAPEYRIHIPVVQMLLEVVGKPGYQKLIPSIIDTLRKLPPHEMTPSECQKLMLSSQLRVSEIDTNYNKGNDNNNSNNNKERDVATATARSQSFPSSQEIQDDETVKREAVKPSQKDTTHGTSADTTPGSSAMDNARAASGSHVKRQDTNKVGTPPAPDKSQTNQITSTPHAKPVEPHADMQWGTRKCLQWFDYWRGGILIAKYKLMEASRCAKGLAEQFDEKTVIQIRDRMAQDTFWMERGGPDVCDVANNIHKELNKKSAKPTGKNEKDGYRRISSFDDPNFTMEHEFYPSEREKREAAQAAQQGVKA